MTAPVNIGSTHRSIDAASQYEWRKLMRHFISVAAVAFACFIGAASVGTAQTNRSGKTHNPANTISLEADDPDSFRNFAPELDKTLAKVPKINSETGTYVKEIEPQLFFVTDGIYQSAFLVTNEGVVVFDAPPSYAQKLLDAIKKAAPNTPIKYLVYSHGHADHVGGSSIFKDIPGLTIVAQAQVAESLKQRANPSILPPTKTFDDAYTFSLGEDRIELKSAKFHSEDRDVIIYLPNQKFLMAVDTITPGEAPFMNFGVTADIGAYTRIFDQLLGYKFEHFLSGHVSVLGNRDDVVTAQKYVLDVRSAVEQRMTEFPTLFSIALEKLEFKNGNLAYRYALETIRDECAQDIIGKWKDDLSVVDVWGPSHCEQMVLYFVMH
jgi:glyoxylase-like metal-dependent hydrolase (beta-lactamase superfamily II)